MKYFIIAIFGFILSCSGPVSEPVSASVKHTAYVVDSFWKTVKSVPFTGSRTLDSSVQAGVDAFNASNNANQEQILIDTVPPIAQSPLANVFIVNASTHAVIEDYTDTPLGAEVPNGGPIDRSTLMDRIGLWNQQALNDGGVLFIDKVPDLAAPIVDLRTDTEKYIIYIIQANGHIDYTCDLAAAWNADHQGMTIVQMYNTQITQWVPAVLIQNPGDHCITGVFYVDPTL